MKAKTQEINKNIAKHQSSKKIRLTNLNTIKNKTNLSNKKRNEEINLQIKTDDEKIFSELNSNKKEDKHKKTVNYI